MINATKDKLVSVEGHCWHRPAAHESKGMDWYPVLQLLYGSANARST